MSDTFNWRIQQLTANGAFVREFGSRLTLDYARGIAVDRAQGAVVVANTDAQRVDKYTATGTRVWTAPGIQAFSVAVDQANGVIYAGQITANTVTVVSPNGAVLRSLGQSQLANPRGVAVDPIDGSVWVSNQNTGRVVHFSAAGALLASFASGALRAAELEVDEDTIYLADRAGNVIRMSAKNGTAVGTFGGSGGALGRFTLPQGPELFGDRLFVVESGGERIHELRVVRS